MTGQASNAGTFRPAPFPVYAPTSRPALTSLVRRAAAFVITLLVLAPFALDTGRAAGDGVQVASVELGRREPVLLTCDFSLEGFSACPPQLGEFTGDRQFQCSGDAPRGMLYGILDGSPHVVLISYSADAVPEIDHLLAEIRARVDVMNSRRNMVRQAKERRGKAPSEATGLPGWFWDPVPGSVRSSEFVDLAGSLADSGETDEEITRRLARRAADTSSLKRLYYGAQEARIDLLAAQFDLQLALAHSPEQDVPGMLVLGGSGAAREAMLTEISRMSGTWRERLEQLESQANRDRAWLRTEQTPRPASGWGVFSFIPGMRDRESGLESAAADAPGSPASRLERGYREARLEIAEAEIEALKSGLARLAELDRRVGGGPAAGAVSHRVALGSAMFADPELEELPGYPALTQIVRQGEAEILWAQLAAEFAGMAEGPAHLAQSGSIPEVMYCLASADLEAHLRPERWPAAEGGGSPDGEFAAGKVEAYEGFMRFAQWYAGLASAAQE